MTPRRKKAEPSALAGKKATVWLERNGCGIKVEDVDASVAGVVAADLLAAFRHLEALYPELVSDLTPVPGGAPIDVVEDDYAEEGQRRKRLGFQ